jgi:hypothetical protein
MQFSVADRLHLLGVTKVVEGNIVTLRTVRDLQQQLGFSDEESQALAFRQEGGSVYWNPETSPKDIEVTPTARKAVLAAFQQFDQREAITIDLLALYERFQE